MKFCTGTYCKLTGEKCYYEPDPLCPLGWLEWILESLMLSFKKDLKA